jgi:hypothetical protein
VKPDLGTVGADVQALVQTLGNHLAGKSPLLISAALADLLATVLAGHIIRRDPTATDALREDLLEGHIALVRSLIPINAAAIHGSDEDGPHAHHS